MLMMVVVNASCSYRVKVIGCCASLTCYIVSSNNSLQVVAYLRFSLCVDNVFWTSLPFELFAIEVVNGDTGV